MRTLVPEVTHDEDGNPSTGENDVWASGTHSLSDPVAEPTVVQGSTECHLRPGAGPLLPAHLLSDGKAAGPRRGW